MNIKMKPKPFKGYFPFLRAILLLFINRSLGFASLGAFLAFVSECDWDKKHTTYGLVTKTDQYLSAKWRCDPSTIWRRRQDLIEMGLFSYNEDGYLKLNYIDLFDLSYARKLGRMSFATPQELNEKMQEIIAKDQSNIADMQKKQDQSTLQNFNDSFKGNSGVLSSNLEIISDKEMDKIVEEIERKDS